MPPRSMPTMPSSAPASVINLLKQAAAALTAAGRLAAGDYRLLFEIGPDDTLHLTDFILRRDLDRWIAGGGR